MTEDQIRELLRDMRDEPIPADSLARVRLGVAERSQVRLHWKLAVAIFAAACLVFGALVFRPGEPAPRPEPAAVASEVEVPVLSPIQAPAPEPAKKAPTRKRVAVPVRRSVPPPGVLIRIENEDDPDVVILLVN